MIDPLIQKIISLGFALLFLLACTHKLRNREHFRASFRAYEIVPMGLSNFVANSITGLEFFVGCGWLALGLFGLKFDIVIYLSIALLASYASAIAINLNRGRHYIDCGCSFSGNNVSGPENHSQQISSGLLMRNGVLILAAATCALPASARDLQLTDIYGLTLSLVALILIYGTYNQLVMNKNIISSWRQNNA